LGDEDHIESHADIREPQFERIARNAAPIATKTRVQDELCNGEQTPCEIEQNLPDAPTFGGLALVVEKSLRDVLDECDDEFNIPQSVQLQHLR